MSVDKGVVIAGIIGLGAVGLGAYALTRNSGTKQQTSSTDSAFSGFTGGGNTGSYSQPTLAESLGTALSTAFQTPSSQVEPFSEIIPEMQAMSNPSDEVSDVNQVLGNLRTLNALPGYDPSKTELYLSGVQRDQNTSTSTTPAEYNQGTSFGPAPKQADMSSYNEVKTGGKTENTASGAQGLSNYPSSGVANTASGAQGSSNTAKRTSEKKESTEKTPSSGTMQVQGILAPVGSLVGGLFGW